MVKVSGIFNDIDSIDYLLIKPKVFFHLITVTQESRFNLYEFIIANLQTYESLLQKLTLIDKFIHQMIFLISEAKALEKASLITEFNNYKAEIINRLIQIKAVVRANPYLNLIINSLVPHHIKIEFIKIYNTGFLNQDTCIPLAQQIKLRRLNEIGHNYSVSFNHLLNEFQNLFELAYFESTQQTAKEITKKMSEENYKMEEITFVGNFFERRNQNSISHTNTNDIGLWGVGQIEYLEYKMQVFPLIEKLFKKINFQ